MQNDGKNDDNLEKIKKNLNLSLGDSENAAISRVIALSNILYLFFPEEEGIEEVKLSDIEEKFQESLDIVFKFVLICKNRGVLKNSPIL